MKKLVGIVVLLVAIGFAGFWATPWLVPDDVPAQLATTTTPDTVTLDNTWKLLAPGAERLQYQVTITAPKLIIYRFDHALYDFTLHDASLLGSAGAYTIPQWQELLNQPDLLINGVYFNADNSPTGFLRIDGRTINAHQFSQNQSGAVVINDTLQIIDTASTQLDLENQQSAAQNFPLLISDGQPQIDNDSQELSRRSFIGTDTAGLLYIGIVPTRDYSLYGLMQALLELDIDWDTVLNLDGGQSTGLSSNLGDGELIHSFTPIPNVLSVTKKD